MNLGRSFRACIASSRKYLRPVGTLEIKKFNRPYGTRNSLCRECAGRKRPA
jgi:hypothetical protein